MQDVDQNLTFCRDSSLLTLLQNVRLLAGKSLAKDAASDAKYFFLTSRVSEAEPVIRQKLTSLDHKIQRLRKEGDIDIYPAMRCWQTPQSPPGIEAKLVQSLDASIPSRDALPPLLELEKIGYLAMNSSNSILYGFGRFTSSTLRHRNSLEGRGDKLENDDIIRSLADMIVEELSIATVR
ncbi:hypothetical protein CSPX01_07120 [Colletotrichum filicis]|nr:hypothetical protein CSPX01_07120 [Colletotrichum filicis]